jgi:hypothetical protein
LNFLKDKKGQVRTIEAIFATILLMSCLALIPSTSNVKDSTRNLTSTAQNVLLILDTNGYLATLVNNQNWAAIKDCLQSALPLTIWFNLTVFNQNMNSLNSFPICNAGTASAKIVSVDYVCASQNSTYAIYILRLQLSEVGLT